MTNEIVPFGKYKGRPVEDVAADRQYSDWLMEQQWFRERFATLYATMAALHQPAETPEHNAMQARFLDDAWCAKTVQAIGAAPEPDGDWKYIAGAQYRFFPNGKFLAMTVDKAKFEVKGADVELPVKNGVSDFLSSRHEGGINDVFRIELKPTLGDEYPAALRQVAAAGCHVLVVGYFQAQGATLEQVREIFQRSRVKLILQSEIEEQKGW